MTLDKYDKYDVYMAKLPKRSGSIQQGTRPVVIYSGSDYDYLNQEDRITLQCYCLTTKDKNKLPVHFLIEKNRSCLSEDSIFLAEQVFQLSEGNLLYKIGNITDKEYRYMMFKTINIQTSDTPKIMFKYSYKFLVEAKESSQYLEAVKFLTEKEDVKEELKNALKSYHEPAKNMVRDVCKKHNVIADRYMKDLSDGNIDFSLLNL